MYSYMVGYQLPIARSVDLSVHIQLKIFVSSELRQPRGLNNVEPIEAYLGGGEYYSLCLAS